MEYGRTTWIAVATDSDFLPYAAQPDPAFNFDLIDEAFVLSDGGGQRGRGAGCACGAGRAAHNAAQA